VHLVVVPQPDIPLPKIMQYIKGRFSRLYHARNGGSGKLWQGRYYETTIRDEAALFRRIEYIEENPVQSGLASRPEDYAFSSGAIGRIDFEAYLAPDQREGAIVPG
jgi:putative transposase